MKKLSTPDPGSRKPIHPVSLRPALVLGTILTLAGLAVVPVAGMTGTVSLRFESQGLDLDTGTIVELGPDGLAGANGADLYLANNADRTPHTVVVIRESGAEIAILAGLEFQLVISRDIETAKFSSDTPDLPWLDSDTVLIRTGDGSVFKLGKAAETDGSVTFEFELLP